MSEKAVTKKQLEEQLVAQNPNAFVGISRTQKDKILNSFLRSSPQAGPVQSNKTEMMYYQGAIPHPDLMEGFKRVNSELPLIITNMAVDAMTSTIKKEDKVIEAVFDLKRRGQWMAFGLSSMSMIFGFVLLLLDKDVAGYIGVGTGVALIVAAFLGVSIPKMNTTPKNPQEEGVSAD